MAAIGLLYVGAVLFVNGLVLAGVVNGRSAAPLNVFVGALQVMTPTYLIVTANGDPDVLLFASGLYLFGFTYLYVAYLLFTGMDTAGFGYFALFVAICAVAYSLVNFLRSGDPVFGVLWLYWSFLWVMFFLVFGLKKGALARFTGIVAAVEGWLTAVVPAALILLGVYGRYSVPMAVAFAVVGVVMFPALYLVDRRAAAAAAVAEPPARVPAPAAL